MPSCFVVKNGSNSRSSRSDGIPGPVSRIETWASPSRRPRPAGDLAHAVRHLRNGIDPVDDQIQNDLLELDPVPVHPQSLVGELAVQPHVTGGGLRGQDRKHFADHFIEVHLLRVEGTSREETPQALDDLARPLIVALDVIDDRLDFLQVRRSGN